MTVADALGHLPVQVNQMFAIARQGGGTGKVMDALNEVYRHAQEDSDMLSFKCKAKKEQALAEVEVARAGLVEAEKALTLLGDRMMSLQSGMDRSLAELQVLREQFETHRTACREQQGRQTTALQLLKKDLPLATQLASTVTQGCGFNGGTPPPLVECSLPDGSFLVTFKDETLRVQVGQLSGLSERLLALHLDRAVRSQMVTSSDALLLQTHRKSRRVRGQPASRHPRMRRRLLHAWRFHERQYLRQRHLELLHRRQLLSRRQLPAAMCTDATPPACESFADHMTSFVGGVEDLADELKVRMQSESDHCRRSLDNYASRIKELKHSSDDSSVALANAVAQEGELSSARRERREQVEDLTREARRSIEDCDRQQEQAMNAMCSAKALVRELSASGGATGAFMGDCEVSEWVAGPCSQPCGTKGVQNLTRRIIKAPEKGQLCPALEATRACNEKPCPVDGLMGRWEDWSECSRACGGGTKTRHRRVIREAQFGGVPTGETMQEQLCNAYGCDQDCALSDWTAWTNCSKACLGGHRTRVRNVLRPALGNGVCPSEEDPLRRQSTACNRKACTASPAPQCGSGIDLVLVLDGSGSMGTKGFDAVKLFAQKVAARTKLGDATPPSASTAAGAAPPSKPLARIGAVFFGTRAFVAQEPTADKDKLLSGIQATLWQRSATNTGEALAVAGDLLTKYGRVGAQPVIAVLTDGMPLSSYIVSTEADKLRARGVRLSFVLVGPGVSRRAIKGWASWPTAENVVAARNFKALTDEATVTAFLANLCPDFQ